MDIKRNTLTHLVLWPTGRKAKISLIDADGVTWGETTVDAPVVGSELVRKVPDGMYVECEGLNAVSMAGQPLYGGRGAFDTKVVTERAERTTEEKLDLILRRQKRQDKRLADLAAENDRLRNPVIEEPQEEPADPREEPQDPPTDTPEETSDA